MAVNFDGTNDYLNLATPVVTDDPITMAAWIYPANVASAMGIIGVGTGTGAFQEFHMYLNTDDLLVMARNEGSYPYAISAGNVSANTWHHVCGRFVSTFSRSAFVDGGNRGDNAAEGNPNSGSINVTRIGQYPNTTNNKFEGYIAEATIWNVALTNDEVAILGKGYSSLLVRPQNIAAYVPLVRNTFDDLVGGVSFSEVGSLAVADHPRIIYPGGLSPLISGSTPATSPYGPPIQVY